MLATCLGHARDKGVRHPFIGRGFGQISGSGTAVAAPFWKQPTPQGAVVAHQYGCLRQDQFHESVLVSVYGFILPPRQTGHVGNHWHIGVVSTNFSHRGKNIRGATKTNFDHLNRNVFQDGAGLFINRLFIHRNIVENLGGIAYITSRGDRQYMSAYRRHRQDVCG